MAKKTLWSKNIEKIRGAKNGQNAAGHLAERKNRDRER